MKTSEVLFLLFLVSCGGDEKINCLTREQKRALCLAELIEKEPEPWKYAFHVQECNNRFIAEGCYEY